MGATWFILLILALIGVVFFFYAREKRTAPRPSISVPQEPIDLDTLLKLKGFKPVAEVQYGLPISLYWNSTERCELAVTLAGPGYLVKGIKRYRMLSVDPDAYETWDRNLGQLMDQLRKSFPEFHLYACGVMQPTVEMIPEGLRLQQQYQKIRTLEQNADQAIQKLARVRGYRSSEPDYIRDKIAEHTPKSIKDSFRAIGQSLNVNNPQELEAEVYTLTQQLAQEQADYKALFEEHQEIIKEYLQKGVATSYLFAYSTPLRVADTKTIEIAVDKILEDIRIAHVHGGFTQVLERSLHIKYEEVSNPYVSLWAEFACLFAPDELKQKAPELLDYVLPYFLLSAVDDIVVAGRVKDKAKRTPARVFKAFLDRVEKVSTQIDTDRLPAEGGWIGNAMQGERMTEVPFLLPLDKLNHAYISGTTGIGKSCLARAVIENAILDGINVIVLDPTGQWTGLAKKAEHIERRLQNLGVWKDLALAFPISVHDASVDPQTLLNGTHVVNLKGADDVRICQAAKSILESIYNAFEKETDRLKCLIVLEEAYSFLPDHVMTEARGLADDVSAFLNRITPTRENRAEIYGKGI